MPAASVILPVSLPPDAEGPFGIVRLPTVDLRRLCEIDDGDPVRDPLASRRTVVARDGHLLLADVAGEDAVQIGPRTTFAEAGEIATAVLLAGAAPLCLHTLALAFMAALSEVERLRRLARGAAAGGQP